MMAALQSAGGSGDESGAVAFRCLACDRPLPPANEWTAPASNMSTLAKQRRPRTSNGVRRTASRGGSRNIGDDQSEIVMRGGFPMMNPKVAPEDRTLVSPAAAALSCVPHSLCSHLLSAFVALLFFCSKFLSSAASALTPSTGFLSIATELSPLAAQDHSRLFGNNLQRGHPRSLPSDSDLPTMSQPDSSLMSAGSGGGLGQLSPLKGNHSPRDSTTPLAARGGSANGSYGQGPLAQEQSWPPPTVARMGAMPHSAHSADPIM